MEQDLFLSKLPHLSLHRLAPSEMGIEALERELADVFVTALNTVRPLLNKEEGRKFQFAPIHGSSENCAIAVQKEQKDFLADVQRALDAMEADGSIARFRHHWGI